MTAAATTIAAQAAGTPAAGATLSAGSTLSAIGGMVFALLIVLALIFALAWLLRRLPGAGMQAPAGLHVVSSLSVGPKERLLVIEAGDRQLLIGVTASQISMLHELPTPLPVASPGPGFAELLAKGLHKMAPQMAALQKPALQETALQKAALQQVALQQAATP